MKKWIMRVIPMLLLFAMLATMVACGGEKPGQEVNTGDLTVDDGKSLAFGKENYGKDMTVLYYTCEIYKNFFFDDATQAGDVIQSALVERRFLVEEYLGVNVIGKAEGDREDSIVTVLQRDLLAGQDNYQAALTHSYIGVGALIAQGNIIDLYDLEDISFDDEYWHMDAIEGLEVGGKAYYGSSDYQIADVQAIFFNKDMYSTYSIEENPYDLVRTGKWTMEKFMELCSVVAENTGDSVWDKYDTYGLGVRADWEFIPLVSSCEIEWLSGSKGGYRTLNMGPSNEKYLTLYEWVEDMADADWSYMYNWGDNDNKVTIADGRFLFTMEPVKYSYKYLESEVKFGFLPYPKFDEAQKEYHSLDASGMLCVPSTVRDKTMVGKTLECLAFYSADTVNEAYYERLLGTRVANALDDAEMLDTYIFGNITSNPVFNFSEKANQPLGILVYTIPKMLRAKLNGTTIATISQNWGENKVPAQKVIDETINR